MSLLDLTRLPASGAARLAAVTYRVDGVKDDGALIADLDLEVDVAAADLPAVDRLLWPGAAALCAEPGEPDDPRDRARDDDGEAPPDAVGGRRVLLTDKSAREDVVLDVTDPDDGARVLAHGRAEVRQVKLALAGPASVVTTRVRLRGPAASLKDLVGRLDRAVGLRAEPVQGGLFAGRPAPRKVPAAGEVVSAVTADGVSVVGVVEEVAKDGGAVTLTVRDLGRDPVAVPLDRVRSSVRVVAPDGKSLPAVLRAYQRRAAKAGVDASWATLIDHLGRQYGGGAAAPRPDGAWELSRAVVDAACGAAPAPRGRHDVPPAADAS